MNCIRVHPNSHSLTLRISMALQATEAQDLPLSGFLDLVFKPHKFISVQISTNHQVHFVKTRGESTSKETLTPPKNCRYKQHEAYTETAGFLSDQTVTF